MFVGWVPQVESCWLADSHHRVSKRIHRVALLNKTGSEICGLLSPLREAGWSRHAWEGWMDPSETGKGKQPKEQHEISDSAVDLRSFFLGGGFLFIVRRLPHEHRSRRRSGLIGNLRWKSGGERGRRRGRNHHHWRATRDRWCSGPGRLCDRWVNPGTGRLSGWRVDAGDGRLSECRNNCGTGRLSSRWVDCGNRRAFDRWGNAEHGWSQWNGGWQWRWRWRSQWRSQRRSQWRSQRR